MNPIKEKKIKRKKNVFVITALLVSISAGILFLLWISFKEARNIASEMPYYTIASTKLLTDYNSNPQRADAVYLNKTIEITGKVTKEIDSVTMFMVARFGN